MSNKVHLHIGFERAERQSPITFPVWAVLRPDRRQLADRRRVTRGGRRITDLIGEDDDQAPEELEPLAVVAGPAPH